MDNGWSLQQISTRQLLEELARRGAEINASGRDDPLIVVRKEQSTNGGLIAPIIVECPTVILIGRDIYDPAG